MERKKMFGKWIFKEMFFLMVYPA